MVKDVRVFYWGRFSSENEELWSVIRPDYRQNGQFGRRPNASEFRSQSPFRTRQTLSQKFPPNSNTILFLRITKKMFAIGTYKCIALIKNQVRNIS